MGKISDWLDQGEKQGDGTGKVRSWLEDDATRLGATLDAARQKRPDQYADSLNLSEQTKLPVDAVEQNLDMVQQGVAKRQVDPAEMLKASPGVSRWLMDANNAAIAHDEVDKLTDMESAAMAWNETRRSVTGGIRGTSRDGLIEAGLAFRTGTTQLGAGSLSLAIAYGVADVNEWADTLAEQNRRLMQLHAQRPEFAQRFDEATGAVGQRMEAVDDAMAARIADSDAQGATADSVLQRLDRFLYGMIGAAEFVGAAAQEPRGLAYATVEQTPNSLPALAAGAGLAKVGAAGGSFFGPLGTAAGGIGGLASGTFIGSAPVEMGAVIHGKMLETGMDPTDPEQIKAFFADAESLAQIKAEAERKGITTALVDGLWNMTAGKLFAIRGGSMGSRAAAGATDTGVQMAGESISEAAGQYAQTGEVDLGEAMLEGVISGPQSVAETVIGASLRRAVDRGDDGDTMATVADGAMKSEQAKESGGRLARLVEAVKGLKTGERSEERTDQLLQSVLGDGDLYVNADELSTLFQTNEIDVQQGLSDLGIDTADYQQATSTGGDIVVPAARLVRFAAKSDIGQSLIQVVKTDPEAMSAADAAKWDEESRPIIEEYLNSDATQDDATQPIYDSIYGQLTAAGAREQDAQYQAKLIQMAFRTMAERTGQDANKLFEQYNLRVNREVPGELRGGGDIDMQLAPLVSRLRAGDVPTDTDVYGQSLVEFLRERGGIVDEGGELEARDADLNNKPFQRNLIQPEGMTLDAAAEAAMQEGFLQEFDQNQLLELIDRELRGEPVYATGRENTEAADQRAALDLLDEELRARGIDLDSLSDEEVLAALKDAAEDVQEGEQIEQGPADDYTGPFREYPELLRESVIEERRADLEAAGIEATDDQLAAMAERAQPRLDEVTGAYAREARRVLIAEAMRVVRQDGASAQYISMDLANLGGLNQAGGTADVDSMIFRPVREIVQRELEATGAQSVSMIRQGGDEISAVVVGIDEATVQAAMDRAADAFYEEVVTRLRTKDESKTPVALLNNPKGGPKGTTIYRVVADVPGTGNVDTYIGAVDARVELEKKARKGILDDEAQPVGFEPIPESELAAARERIANEAAVADGGQGSSPGPAEAGADVTEAAAVRGGDNRAGGRPRGRIGQILDIFRPNKLNQESPAQAGLSDSETPEFQRWFGDSKVVDENGDPLVVYHGTTNDITEFDVERANIESDMGGGFYFSNNPDDVAANYASDEGPDLTQRIEILAERMASERDVDVDDVRDEARQALSQGTPNTMPVYLSFQNPVQIGGESETVFTLEMVYESDQFMDDAREEIESDYADDIQDGTYDAEEVNQMVDERAKEMAEENGYMDEGGNIVEFIEALRSSAFEFSDVDVEQAISDLMESGDAYDGIEASDLVRRLKASEGIMYATDDEGTLASSELIRKAFEEAGFDGVIDRTVNQKFGTERAMGKSMDGMNEDTVHYIAFQPEQIKSASGNRGTFDPNSANILEQAAFHGSPYRFDKFSLDAIGTGEGAQAYGWGLYFAGKRGVAEYYRDALTDPEQMSMTLNGKPADAVSINENRERFPEMYEGLNEDQAEDMDFITGNLFQTSNIADYERGVVPSFSPEQRRLYNELVKPNLSDPDPDPGSLYQVDIPSDDQLLDWDALIDEQPSGVLEKLNSTDWFKYAREQSEDRVDNATGRDIYNWLLDDFTPQEASEMLNAAGIPGLSYLDATSRGGNGDGSRNYVIWDEGVVTVEAVNDELVQAELQQGPRGYMTFDAARNFSITLTQRADLSTFLHEAGHFFLEVMADAAGQSDQVAGDFQTILDWLGVESRDDILLTGKRKDSQEYARAVEAHEKWARGFEAYLREGKAPSQELRSAFARFRAWLVGIYRNIKKLNVDLSDEVRGVMDRMLATDDEIAAAQRDQGYEAMFETAEQAGMTDEEWAEYQQAVERATDEAQRLLAGKAMDEYRRANSGWWKDRRDEIEQDVLKELDQNPVYVALSWLRTGKMPSGADLPGGIEPAKIDKQSLLDQYGQAFLTKNLRRLNIYRLEGGIPARVAAEMLGFSSVDEMVKKLVDAVPMKQYVTAEAERRMQEQYPDMFQSGQVTEEAMASVHNERQQELLYREATALGKRINKKPSVRSVARETAREVIARTPVKRIRPSVYRMAEAKAARLSFEAAAKGDRVEAFNQKQRQILNFFLYREAEKAVQEADDIAKRMRGYNKASTQQRLGKAGGSYLDQVNQILALYDFRKVPLKEVGRRQSLRDWLNSLRDSQDDGLDVGEAEAEALAAVIPPWVMEQAEVVNYRELSMEQLRGVDDSVRAIAHLARVKNKLLAIRDKRELAEVVAEVVDTIKANGPGRKPGVETRLPKDEAKRTIEWFFASHRKMASLLKEMDGLVDGGVMWQTIMRPINEAGDQSASMKQEAAERFRALYDLYSKDELVKLYEQEYIPEIEQSLSKQARLAVALNWGNEDSRQKVMDGYKWSEWQVSKILDGLSERDWQFVQGMWDFINEYWPAVEAKEKRVKGVAPEKVKAMEVQTKYGPVRGGYYPLMYDERQDSKSYKQTAEQFAQEMLNASRTSATTRRGHTNERVKGVQRPVRLDLGVAFEHVNQVIHDLTHHEVLFDVSRVLRHKEVAGAILEQYGDIVYRQMQDALTDIAAGDVESGKQYEKAFNWIRSGVTIAGMGWSISTALMQPIGYTQSVHRVGGRWMLRGMSKFWGTPQKMNEATQWVYSKSKFMQERSRTLTRDINDIRNKVRGKGKLAAVIDRTVSAATLGKVDHDMVADTYFWLIAKLQQIVDTPTWIGEYEKQMELGVDETEAARLADQAVIDSQGGGQVKDLASIQRGTPAFRLFTVFYSYFNTLFNLTVESVKGTDFKKPGDVGAFMVDMLLLYTIPAILTTAIRAAMGKGDDDDELLAELAREHLSMALGSMVGLRELSGVAAGFGDYSGPAGTRFFSEAARFSVQAQQGEIDQAFMKALNQTAGILFHYPATQVQRTTEGFVELTAGNTSNPTVLLTGPRN